MEQLKSSNFRNEWNKLELLEQPDKMEHLTPNGISGTERNG